MGDDTAKDRTDELDGAEALEPHPFLPNRAFETSDPAAELEEAAEELADGPAGDD